MVIYIHILQRNLSLRCLNASLGAQDRKQRSFVVQDENNQLVILLTERVTPHSGAVVI